VIVKQKKFGNDGPDVSVIGQGTWYLDRGDRKAAIAALRRGIETGMTHIDTAEMYGEAEPVIADAIAGLSAIACELGGELEALDINPLICGPAGAVAVDALLLRRV